jgi:hypothetical protein
MLNPRYPCEIIKLLSVSVDTESIVLQESIVFDILFDRKDYTFVNVGTATNPLFVSTVYISLMRITCVEKSDRLKYTRVTSILFKGTASQPIITQFCTESLFNYKIRPGKNRLYCNSRTFQKLIGQNLTSHFCFAT